MTHLVIGDHIDYRLCKQRATPNLHLGNLWEILAINLCGGTFGCEPALLETSSADLPGRSFPGGFGRSCRGSNVFTRAVPQLSKSSWAAKADQVTSRRKRIRVCADPARKFASQEELSPLTKPRCEAASALSYSRLR
jgi:hypothetical protein